MKFLFVLLCCHVSFSQIKKCDTTSIFFELDSYHLKPEALNEINALTSEDNFSQLDSVFVIGYTDFLGSKSYNKKLAQNRLNAITNVVNFKKTKFNTLAYGEITPITQARPNEGFKAHRKVDFIRYYSIKTETSQFPNKEINKKYTYLDSLHRFNTGEKIRLKHINFLLGTSNLTKASIPELDHLSDLMHQHKYLNISIEGHVCCGPEREFVNKKMSVENEYLSRKRAEKIYHYLLSKGIKADRLQFKAYGFTEPLVFPETSEEDRYKNRRIEVRIISNNYLEALNTIEIGETIRLRHINFAWGKYDLTPKSAKEIENLYLILDKHSSLNIIIEGHVCCGRKEEALGEKTSHHNYTLSYNRALAVKQALVEKGIEDSRIGVKGYGFTKPLLFPENKDDNSRAVNRRIEVKVIKR